MLHIRFGKKSNNLVLDPDLQFKYSFKKEWLDNQLVRDMIKDIDKSTVQSNQCIMSPVFNQIAPDYLSGGVKMLIMMYYMDDVEFWAQACGENCEKWIYRIAENKDLTIRLSNMMTFNDIGRFNIPVIVHTEDGQNIQVKDSKELTYIEIDNADSFDIV